MDKARRARGRPRRPRGTEVSPSRRPSRRSLNSATHPSRLGPWSEPRQTPKPQGQHNPLEMPLVDLIGATEELARLQEFARFHAVEFNKFHPKKCQKNKDEEPLPSSTTTRRHCIKSPVVPHYNGTTDPKLFLSHLRYAMIN